MSDISNKYPVPPFPPENIKPPGVEDKMKTSPEFRAEAYQPAGKLSKKVALITGGDSGIGRAVAVLFAKEGADIGIVYLSPEERVDAQKVKTTVEQLGLRCMLFEGDVGQSKFCQETCADMQDKFGHIDILVNNAAFQNHVQDIEDLTERQWDHTFRTNIYGYFFMVKACLPYMKEGASIINCGSQTGLEGSKGLLDYSATKGAVHAFTKSLAQHLVKRKIRVNCVAPGPVWTPLNPAERSYEEMKGFGAKTPYGRPAQPEEISPAFVFLASNADSNYITGEVLAIMGGQTTAG